VVWIETSIRNTCFGRNIGVHIVGLRRALSDRNFQHGAGISESNRVGKTTTRAIGRRSLHREDRQKTIVAGLSVADVVPERGCARETEFTSYNWRLPLRHPARVLG